MFKKQNKITILPTDTLYGICTSALDRRAVENIYEIKGRNEKKPFIILISKVKDMQAFGVSKVFLARHGALLDRVWPGKVTVIVPAPGKIFAYLHRGTNALAFRMPKKKALQSILKKTGPLVAPSANPEGMKPAETVKEARAYFGERVDAYIAGGRLGGKPSTIIEITNDGSVKLVRDGAVKIQLTDEATS